MREILFRGKRIDNGEWVEGYVWEGNNSCYIIPIDTAIGYYEKESRMIAFANEIDPETVCQYTGLNDRNGKKIFEGDIVTIPYSKKPGLPAEIHYSLVDAGFYIRRHGYIGISLEDSQRWCEVIGNVFDTPELVSG